MDNKTRIMHLQAEKEMIAERLESARKLVEFHNKGLLQSESDLKTFEAWVKDIEDKMRAIDERFFLDKVYKIKTVEGCFMLGEYIIHINKDMVWILAITKQEYWGRWVSAELVSTSEDGRKYLDYSVMQELTGGLQDSFITLEEYIKTIC